MWGMIEFTFICDLRDSPRSRDAFIPKKSIYVKVHDSPDSYLREKMLTSSEPTIH